MITKNHPTKYADLFNKAQEVLRKYGDSAYKEIKISNIDDYFSVLKDLADIEIASEKQELLDDNGQPVYIDPIFTILPTTEEMFEINADTRSIKIPDNFARYGVGVQGDEIAEILYFSIDRYFDAMDLADMDIIIQWKREGENDLANTLSATYKKSLTLQPGKIVFGWPIISDMTNTSGNIKFSVRFYRRANDTLIYSFSTLPATIKIQSGLNFKLTEDHTLLAFNRNQNIHNNLRNSKKYNNNYIIASPEFVAYYTLLDDEFITATEENYDLPVTLVAKAEIPSNTPTDQFISGTGLSYNWYNIENPDTVLSSSYVYKVDPKTTFNPNEIYYVLQTDDDGQDYYEPYYNTNDNNPFDDIIDGEPIVLYTRHSAFTPTAAGSYKAVAKNIYANEGSNSASASSRSWTIPRPEMPVFSYNPENRIALLAEDTSITIDANVSDNGTLVTNWYQSVSNNSADATIIQDATTNTYIPTTEGYYFVQASNSKNNDTVTVFSEPIWVHYSASEIGDLNYFVNNVQVTNLAVDIGSVLSITFNQLTHSENVQYQWYRGTELIPDATTNSYHADQEGNYYCIITNNYKGTSTTKQSDTFKI